MSDDREPTDEPGGDRGPEPHGVVEALREELHEAAQHVPQPVRWTVGKLVRVALISLAGLVVLAVASAALYLANRTQLVAQELTLLVNHTLAQHSDLVLSLRDIKGNPFTGFRLLEPRVRYRSGGAPLLETPEMRVRYSALSLLRGGGGPVDIELDHAVVHLEGGRAGGWRLPAWRSGPAGKGGAPGVRFSLTLHDALLVAPGPVDTVAGIDARLSGDTGGHSRLTLEHLRWARGPWNSQLQELVASIQTDGDSTRIDVPALRTGDLSVRLRGAWRRGGSVKVVHADVERVRWRWLAEVFANDEFDVPGEGRARVDALGDSRWRGGFSGDFDWDSLAVQGRGRFDWDGRKLALDSLVARSEAGDMQGWLRWSKQGWTLAADARNADPSHWHALKLDGWPQGRLAGHFRYDLDSRARVNRSWLVVGLERSEWAGWNVDSARVRVDFPGTASDSFSVTGWRRGGRFDLTATVDPAGWSGPWTVDEFPLDEWPDGRASGLQGTLEHGEGRVVARSGDLFVTGDLDGRGTTWSAASFARWEASDISGRMLPTPDLTLHARLRDGFFTGIHFDSAAAAVRLGNQLVSFAPLRAVAADTVFDATGVGTWNGNEWTVTMSEATASSDQYAWRAEPPLAISGDPKGTVFDHVAARDGDARLDVRGRWASPEGFYDFTVDGRGLDLGRLGMPADWALEGRADAHLEVSGHAGDPHWTFDARASRPGFSAHVCDSVSLSLGGRRSTLEVRHLVYALSGGTARLGGEVSGTARPWPDSLTATAVLRWLSDASAWDGHLEANRLPVSRLGAVVPTADGWAGVLDGRLDVGGSPPAPSLQLEARADDFGWRDYRAQHLQAKASFRDGELVVPDLRVTMQDVVSTLRGRMPVALALGRPPEVPDAPMQWEIDVPRGDLKLLPALVPLIQSARGRFDLAATMAGTTRHPRLTGRAHIRDGIARPAGREEVLEAVYADLTFDESRIHLDSLSARQGRTGRVWSRGSVELAGFGVKNYAFDLHLRDFASSQEGLYAVLFDGDFTVVDGPRVNGQRVPQVLGDVQARRGVVEFDFANQTEVQKRAATTEPLYWTYKIHLGATSNLRWRPPDGDMEFDADLDLEQTPDSLLIYGEMHLVKGHYFFLSNRFNVTQADLTFDNQKGVDPLVDVLATTRLKPSRSELAKGGGWGSTPPPVETITAHLTGRSSQPVIDLSSSSGWDQREILGELTYGRFTAGTDVLSSAADPLQNYLTRQLSNQLSRDLSKFFNDAINQWEVERDQGELLSGQGGVVMSLGGDINSRTSWTYKQRLPGLDRPVTGIAPSTSLFDRDVEVEYRINRFIYATTELTQRRLGLATPGQNNTDFNVSLKARWEY
jgi:hypothetical protein